MNKVVTHHDKIKVAKAIDEIANHSHVIPVAFSVQTVYESGASRNGSAVLIPQKPPEDKVRQCPVRPFGKVSQGVKCLDVISMELVNRRKIEEADRFHVDDPFTTKR